MFNYIVENIRERYSIEELSKRYDISLPSREINESIIKCVDGTNKIDGNFYELVNTNKFKKEKGERAHVNILEEHNALFFESRLNWLQSLLLAIMMFFERIKQKILSFINNLIEKFPESVKAVIKYLVVLPFTLLIMIIVSIRSVFRAPGGIIGIIIGIIITIAIIIPFKLFFELLGLVIAPIINKVSDSMIDKPFIRKMVIGSFVFNNKFNEGIVISNSMVDNITFEVKKNLLGKESLFVVVREGSEKSSLKDSILSWMLPNYFVNRQTVFATNPKFKEKFEMVFQNKNMR